MLGKFEQLELKRLLTADLASMDSMSWSESLERSDAFDYLVFQGSEDFVGPRLPSHFVNVSRWIVKLTPAAAGDWLRNGGDEAAKFLGSARYQVRGGLGDEGLLLVESVETPEIVNSFLSNHAKVESFERDGRIAGQAEANDELFRDMQNLADINIEEAWDFFANEPSIGSLNVVVPILDTGTDLAHPDLYKNIWLNQGEVPSTIRNSFDLDQDGLLTLYDLNSEQLPQGMVVDFNENGYIDALDLLDERSGWIDGEDNDGNGRTDDLVGWDFTDGDNDPSDENGHGTHVAGIIGAMGNNEIDVAGINWRVSLMPLRVLDNSNAGNTADAIQAMNYINSLRGNDVPIRVVNTSFVSGERNDTLGNAIERAFQEDVLVVAAAGNGNFVDRGVSIDVQRRYPASFESGGIISVAASNNTGDGLAGFSNFGDCGVDVAGSAGCGVDIAAPGVNIISTGLRQIAGATEEPSRNGTSMSAPHVTGVAALMFALRPQATAAEIKNAILDSVTPQDSLEQLVATGGTLNAARALERLLEPATGTLLPVPSVSVGQDSIEVRVRYESPIESGGIVVDSLGDTDIYVTRAGFPDVRYNATLESLELPSDLPEVENVVATYRVLPSDLYPSFTDLNSQQWNASHNGSYTVHVSPNEIMTSRGIGNSPRTLTKEDGEYSFDVNIADSQVKVVSTATELRSAFALQSTRTILLQAGTYDLGGVSLAVSPGSNITVLGAGQEHTFIDGNDMSRAFDVRAGATLRLAGVTVRNGRADVGGAIKNSGTTEILRSRIENNASNTAGGGIWNDGVLRLTTTTVNANRQEQSRGVGGGGLYSSGDLTISQSSITRNTASANGVRTAGGGGGIFLDQSGAVSQSIIRNSTLSGNRSVASSSSFGGAIHHSQGGLSLVHVTITDNEADDIGGIFTLTRDDLTIRNSIISGNNGSDFANIALADDMGIFRSVELNPENRNLVDAPAGLGALAFNGGLTESHALEPNSPAEGTGDWIEPLDQRGFPRPTDGSVSVGAVQKYYAEIRGEVFHDRDGDGMQATEETPLGGWLAYVDVNDNQSFDEGEPHTITTTESYVISNVDPALGEAIVRLQPRRGFAESSPVVVREHDESTPAPIDATATQSELVTPVFHLDFEQETIRDVSSERLNVEVGSSVSVLCEDGSRCEGPRLENGRQLHAANWSGTSDDENQIMIFDHPILDEVSNSSGAISTWVKVDGEGEWNSILLTPNEFSQTAGIELDTIGEDGTGRGVFGSVQGWGTNTFGPKHESNGGPGGSETPPGVWTHVVLTWNDFGDRTVYVNGVPSRTIEGVGAGREFSQNLSDWSIGGNPWDVARASEPNKRRLDGKLADFAIFNSELDAQTIDEIIRRGVPRPPEKVFHLDFSGPANELSDVSDFGMELRVGSLVQTKTGDGPALRSGAVLNSGVWANADTDEAHIDILDNDVLDGISRSAGSVVTWVKVADEGDWNNILKTQCPPEPGVFANDLENCAEFGEARGIELQTDGSHNGVVFGAVQGWAKQASGPLRSQLSGTQEVITTTETPTDVWTHIALTWNAAGDHSIYVNGVPGERVLGVGAEEFGLNDTGDWSIGGDRLVNPNGGDDGCGRSVVIGEPAGTGNCRRLHGELADFAIFDGELSRLMINDIMRDGVPNHVPQEKVGLRTLAGFDPDPIIFGGRVILEDHLGRVQLVDNRGTPVPLVGLNSQVQEGRSPLADGKSIAFDGKLVAFSGPPISSDASSQTSSIYLVDEFGRAETLATKESFAGLTDKEFDALQVYSVSDELTIIGPVSPDSTNVAGRVIVAGKNEQGLYLAERKTDGADDGSNINRLAQAGDVPTDSPSKQFTSFEHAVLSDGKVAFKAAYGEDGFGIYQQPVGAIERRVIRTLVDRETTRLPVGETDAEIQDIGSFDFSGGQLLFHGVTSISEGIYLKDAADRISKIVDSSDGIPGDSGTFRTFGQVGFDQGNAVFVGRGRKTQDSLKSGSHDQVGIYVSLDNQIHKVVDLQPTNQPEIFGGRQPTEINIGPQALSGNQVVFYAAFDDGTDGVFTASFGSESKHIIKLAAGETHHNVDFGRRPLSGKIQGTIFIDRDGNNRKTLLEEGTGFAGVRVSLQSGNGTEIVSMLTAEDGSYEFTDLPTLREYQVSIPESVTRCDERDVDGDCIAESDFSRVLAIDSFDLNAQGLMRVNFPLRQDTTVGQSDRITVRIKQAVGDGSETEVLQNENVRLYLDLDGDQSYTPGLDEIIESSDSTATFTLSRREIGDTAIRVIDADIEDSFNVVSPRSFTTTSNTINDRLDGPTAIVAGKFDDDVHDDLVIANYLLDSSFTFISNYKSNDPTISEIPRGPDSGSGTVALLSDDFDSDGHLDLAGVNFESGSLTIWFGNGDGQFTDQIKTISVGAFPTAVAVSKTQGTVDALFVTSSRDSTVRVIRNLGNREFDASAPPIRNVGDRPLSIAAGHFDDDAATDFVVLSQKDASLHLLSSEVGYAAETLAKVGNRPTQVTVSDFDGDGLDDLAVSGGTRQGRAGITLGFQTNDPLQGRQFDFDNDGKLTTNPIIALAAADVDQDGAMDLIAAQAGAEFPILVLANDGKGVFTESTLIGSGAFPDSGKVYSLVTQESSQSVDFLLANYETNSLTVVSNEPSDSSGAIYPNKNNLERTEFVFLVEEKVTVSTCSLTGDADGDCVVGFSDFLVLAANFGQSSGDDPSSIGDFDENGTVEFPDFLILAANFGQQNKP